MLVLKSSLPRRTISSGSTLESCRIKIRSSISALYVFRKVVIPENTKEVRESGCPPQVQRSRTNIRENSSFPKARHDFMSARIEPISLAALVLLSNQYLKLNYHQV